MDGETRKTEFSGSQGETLAAALELPVGKPVAYVLFAHCFSCSKDIKAAREIARALRREGFGVLRFDFTGLGGSEGDFANTNFSSNVGDLLQAADFLRREFEAPAILVGHSLGGSAIIAAAPKIPEAIGVVTIGAPAEAAHVLAHVGEQRSEIERSGKATVSLSGRPFTIKKQFIDDLENQDVLSAAKTLGRPLLVLHAPGDLTVGIDNAGDIFTAAKHPKSFISLDTADHLLSNTTDARYAAQVITAWSRRYIDEIGQKADSFDADVQPVTGSAPFVSGGASASLIPGEKFATSTNINGHHFTLDVGTDEGGRNLGPNPTRTVEAALAVCGVMTMKMYAIRKNWPLENAIVTVTRAKGEDAHQARILEKEFEFTGNLDEAQKTRLMEIADKCPVHRMLTGTVTVRHKS